jgi:hypothetical protein
MAENLVWVTDSGYWGKRFPEWQTLLAGSSLTWTSFATEPVKAPSSMFVMATSESA